MLGITTCMLISQKLMYGLAFKDIHFQFCLLVTLFTAHLSRRLTGELIGYPWSGFRPSSSSLSVRSHF